MTIIDDSLPYTSDKLHAIQTAIKPPFLHFDFRLGMELDSLFCSFALMCTLTNRRLGNYFAYY